MMQLFWMQWIDVLFEQHIDISVAGQHVAHNFILHGFTTHIQGIVDAFELFLHSAQRLFDQRNVYFVSARAFTEPLIGLRIKRLPPFNRYRLGTQTPVSTGKLRSVNERLPMHPGPARQPVAEEAQ